MSTPTPSRPRTNLDSCDVDVVHLGAVTQARAALPPEDEIERIAGLAGLVSNVSRLRMLLALQPARWPRAELCVCDLAVVAGTSKSMTSHQLRLLRTAGLVRHRRAGRLTYYRLAETPLLASLVDLASLTTPAKAPVKAPAKAPAAARARGRSTA